MNNAKDSINVAINSSSSFKYKSSILGKSTVNDGDDRSLKNVKIVVLLKYLSTLGRSLEMPLINCKIHLELSWTKDLMYGHNTYVGGDNANDREITFKITNTKLYFLIVIL